MKEVPCKKCGDPIGNGYEINPENSDYCEVCSQALEECMNCGEKDTLENGRCFMCNETIID